MPVYAPLDKDNYPHETELKVKKIAWLETELRGYNANYQVGMERRVIGEKWEPEYRYHVLKWGPNDMRTTKTREVLLETADPDQVIATLAMLLSIEREPR
jgi:tricorn protease-like protein